MRLELDHSRDLLARTPAVVNTLLRSLPDAWTDVNEGTDTWTPRDVVAHLAHCEQTNWIPRVRSLLENDPDLELPTFDRFDHRERYRDVPLADLLDAFTDLAKESPSHKASWCGGSARDVCQRSVGSATPDAMRASAAGTSTRA